MPYPKPRIADTEMGRFMVFSENDLISKQLLNGKIWEPLVLTVGDLFLQKNEGIFLDIGANIGATSIPVALRHPQRQFVAIEAQRIVHNMLCGNAALNGLTNIYPMHAAVIGPDFKEANVILSLPDYGQEKFIGALSIDGRVKKLDTQGGTESVRAVTIDSLGLPKLAVVKIDVEGHEFQVLQGMRQTLIDSKLPPVIYESWRSEEYAWVEEEKTKIQKFLEDLGYELIYADELTMGIAQAKAAPEKLSLQVTRDPIKGIDVKFSYGAIL